MDYYYSRNNQPQGPVPLEQLHELYRTAVIKADTLVVAVGGTEWKPYAILQPATADLAGSAVPGDVPVGGTPLPTASSSTATSRPAVTSSTFSTGAATAAQPGYKNLVLISWVLLSLTALLSIIPLVGCITWVMLIPVFITTVILGVLTIQRGGTTAGILILIASVVVLPLFTLIAPIVTTALFGAITGAGDTRKKPGSPAPLAADASPVPSAAASAPAARRPASGASPAKPAIVEAVEDPEQLFARLDITQNGYLSGTEMKDYQGYDTNKDDQVSRDEFIAGAAPQRTAAAEAPASAEAPNEQDAKQMVNNTMLNFTNAVNSGSFDAFYRTQLSDLWKNEVTPDKLKSGFKVFVDRKVDLTPIFAVEPVLDEPPYVDGNGLLTLVGHYPVPAEQVKVTYELSYSREANWALAGIKVNIKATNEP